MRKGFRLSEIRAMSLDELEAFLSIIYPDKGIVRVCKSLRQDWRTWKKRYVRPASTSGDTAQG